MGSHVYGDFHPPHLSVLCFVGVRVHAVGSHVHGDFHPLHLSVLCFVGVRVPAVGSHVHGDLRASDGSEVLAVASNAVHGRVSVLL